MKKAYEAPVAEKIEFQYQDQVVASACQSAWINLGAVSCTEGNAHWEYLN